MLTPKAQRPTPAPWKNRTHGVCAGVCVTSLNSFGGTLREQALKMEVTEGGEKRFPQQHWHRHAHHAPLFCIFYFLMYSKVTTFHNSIIWLRHFPQDQSFPCPEAVSVTECNTSSAPDFLSASGCIGGPAPGLDDIPAEALSYQRFLHHC